MEDVEAAIPFYTGKIGFDLELRPAPGFAILAPGDLKLPISEPGYSDAGQSTPDGRNPEPGGWNRIRIEAEDLEAIVEDLRESGANLRNEIVSGRGGEQILLEDPAGNPIELFQPK